MTSAEEIAPGIVSHTEEWDIQYYYGEGVHQTFGNLRFYDVRARHIAVYNNGTTGVGLNELKVYGRGMDNSDNICCNNNNYLILPRGQETSLK